MRVVLDTNVLISSLITKGKAAKLLQRLLETRTELVISKEILDEFVDVIRRPKFRQYVEDEQIKAFLRLLLGVAALINVKSTFGVVPDERDNAILAVAHDARAEFIVSGDKHLLTLKKFKQTKIVKAAQMLKIL